MKAPAFITAALLSFAVVSPAAAIDARTHAPAIGTHAGIVEIGFKKKFLAKKFAKSKFSNGFRRNKFGGKKFVGKKFGGKKFGGKKFLGSGKALAKKKLFFSPYGFLR